MIKSKTLFYHPLSNKGFKTEEAANKDYAKIFAANESERKRIENTNKYRDYFRLNAESPDHFRQLIEKKSKEFYDIDIKFTQWEFKYSSHVSIAHSAPIGEKTAWGEYFVVKLFPGFAGRIMGNIKQKNLSDFLYLVTGLHIGCGCSGNNFDMDARFYIQDFPIMNEKYKEYIKYRDCFIKEQRELDKVTFDNVSMCNELYAKDLEAINLRKEIDALEARKRILWDKENAIGQKINLDNPVIFDIKYPADNCKHTDIFGKLFKENY
jgi:hypothetical protein